MHKGGIAGEEAKARFHGLNVYFHVHFYDRSSPHRQNNMSRLHHRVKQFVSADSESIKRNITNHEQFIGKTPVKDIQDDSIHRVFYYMNS